MFKKKFINYLVELSNVILGITIAFGIGRWSEQNKIDELEIKTLKNIRSELIGNEKYLQNVLEANNKNIVIYTDAANDIKKGLEKSNYVFTNVKLLLEDTGKEMAINLGVLSHLDFELARGISYYYKLQDNIQYFEDDYFDHLKQAGTTERYYNQAINKLNNYNNAIIQVIEQENFLFKEIEKYLKEKHDVME